MAKPKLSITQRALTAADANTSPTALKPNPAPHSAKTGPGTLVAFMTGESSAQKENALLKDELKQWEGSAPTKKLDPKLITHSHWANRNEDSFHTPAFEHFKAEIASAGGNIQPIKVRPIPNTSPQQYEIVFGHRRHRACLDLGFEVLALIEALSNVALFEEMDRENREREDLRPYEQGEMYRRALDEGLYPTIRALSEGVGAQSSNVATAIQIAKLPVEILDAFPSRLDIQYRWGAPLTEHYKTHGQRILAAAAGLRAARDNGEEISALETFNALVSPGDPGVRDKSQSQRDILAAGKVVATIKSTKSGPVISIKDKSLPAHKLDEIEKSLTLILSSQAKSK